jgi:hypothetical protein
MKTVKQTAIKLVVAMCLWLAILHLCSCANITPVSVFEYEHIIYQDSTESFKMYKYNYKQDTVLIIGRNAPER